VIKVIIYVRRKNTLTHPKPPDACRSITTLRLPQKKWGVRFHSKEAEEALRNWYGFKIFVAKHYPSLN